MQKPQSIVSRSSASDTKQVGPDGSVDGLYGIGAGVSVAEGKGFWINSVKSGGPADIAGVRKGDLLVGIDGRRPSSLGMLRSLLLGPKGTAVDISLQRKDRLDAGPSSAPPQWVSVVARVVRGGGATGAVQGPVLGIGMGFRLSAGGGFIVSNVQPAGPAERAGVQPGDVICTYNGESLSNKPGSFLTGAPSPRSSIRINHTIAERGRRGESLRSNALARSLGPAMYSLARTGDSYCAVRRCDARLCAQWTQQAGAAVPLPLRARADAAVLPARAAAIAAALPHPSPTREHVACSGLSAQRVVRRGLEQQRRRHRALRDPARREYRPHFRRHCAHAALRTLRCSGRACQPKHADPLDAHIWGRKRVWHGRRHVFGRGLRVYTKRGWAQCQRVRVQWVRDVWHGV